MSTAARILIVDDHGPKRYVKGRILARAGFAVHEAGTVAHARDAILQWRPDLVLLDIRLPDGDGRELCRWIKASPGIHQVVVLQTSAAFVDSSDRVAALDAGADGYLVEPIQPEELVANVRALLRLRQAEAERQSAMTALREADRRKDEFLAMLAHELRNPLAPIRNAVEILATDDQRLRDRARAIIGRQVTHMARLVDDLLEVSRITQGKVVLQRGLVPLRTLVEGAVETARPYIDTCGHALEVSLPEEDLALDVDAVRISQILGNLLHNAAKFTPPGGHIRVIAEREDDWVEISIIDNGVGIAGETLPYVFDLFTQDERSLERSQGGLGIGLSLVRGMVELHDGVVTAESAGRNQGSCFRVRLPVANGRARRARPREAGAPSIEPRRVLVVEDDMDSAEMMGMVLQGYGHEVTIVTDGREAIDAAVAARPDVVLLDIGLPGMDGYELAQKLRRVPETRGAYIIAVSGFGQERDRARSAAAGFDLHLTKPVEPADLAEAIAAAAEAA